MFHKCSTGRWANDAAAMLPKLEGKPTRKRSTKPFTRPDAPHSILPHHAKVQLSVPCQQTAVHDQMDLPVVGLLAQQLPQDLVGVRGALLAGAPLFRLVPVDLGEDVEQPEVDLAVVRVELVPVVSEWTNH